MTEIQVLPHGLEVLEAQEKFIYMQGGVGVGKTFTLGDLMVKYRAETKNNEVLICANTHKQLRDSTLKGITDRLAMYGLNEEEHWSYQEQRGMFDLMGMKSYLRPLENVDKAIAGLTVDKILADEYAFIGRPNLTPKYIHNKLIQRLRGNNGINQFVAVSSPNGIGFLHDIFVTNATNEHKFIQCKTKDNTFLSSSYYNSLLSAYGCVDKLGNPSDELEYLSSLAKQELMGEFVNVQENSIYYAFNKERHLKEVKKTHGTVYVAMDFNVEPMCAIAAQYINGKFNIIDEFIIEQNADTFKMVDLLTKKGYRGARIIPDSTGVNRKTSGKSDFQILRDAGFVIESVRNPIVFDRTNNVNRHCIENLIHINPACKWLIRDLEKVKWRGGKIDQVTDSTLSHVSDALGYLLWKLNPIGMKAKAKIIIG